MAYQVLARKWRPHTFEDVVGQDHVVTALTNALAEERVAQAYLFSGIRGVGKTSVARIFARALNGREAPTEEEARAADGDLDILEVDAATHSKVEQVRELTESLRYKPVHGKYKVVVLDEVHRLSRQAFDALLKIVEEPPPHLVFIFATTEVEHVPATILSRCQEFSFHRVPFGALTEHLRKIAEAESIEVSDAALRLVARAGEGSVRDAVALLDQLATFGSGSIADEDAGRLLGGLDAAVHQRLLESIVGGDGTGVAAVVSEIENEGRDPRHVYGEFLRYCRDALHLAIGGEGAATELPAEEARAAAAVAERAGYENLLRLLHLLLASEENVRRSEAGILAAEIAWLRAAELPKLTAIESVLAGAPPVAGGGAAPVPGGDGEPTSSGGRGGTRDAARPRARQATAVEPSDPNDRAARGPTHDGDAEADPPAQGPSEPAVFEATDEGAPSRVATADRDAAEAPPRSDHPSAEALPEEAATEEAQRTDATPSDEPATVEEPASPDEPEAPPEPLPAPENEGPATQADTEAPPAREAEHALSVEASREPDGGSTPASAKALIELVGRRRQALAAHLSHCDRLDLAPGEPLRLHVATDVAAMRRTLDRPANRDVLRDCLGELGLEPRWEIVASQGRPADEPVETASPEDDDVSGHPVVQAALDIFGGTIESIDSESADDGARESR